MAFRLLSVAVLSGRVGCVLMDGADLKDWAMSRKASRSEADLRTQLETWTRKLAPDAVVSERLEPGTKKHGRTPQLIAEIAAYMTETGALHVRLVRERRFKNKYLEAESLVRRYPELAPWQPERRQFYNNEPQSVVIFEAVVLAEQVLVDPTRHLAEALG